MLLLRTSGIFVHANDTMKCKEKPSCHRFCSMSVFKIPISIFDIYGEKGDGQVISTCPFEIVNKPARSFFLTLYAEITKILLQYGKYKLQHIINSTNFGV